MYFETPVQRGDSMRYSSQLLLTLTALLMLVLVKSACGQSELVRKDSSIFIASGGIALSTPRSSGLAGIAVGILGRVNAGITQRNFNSVHGDPATTGGFIEGLVIKTPGNVSFALGLIVSGGLSSKGNDFVSGGGALHITMAINRRFTLFLAGAGMKVFDTQFGYNAWHGEYAEGVSVGFSRKIRLLGQVQQSALTGRTVESSIVFGFAVLFGKH
jgi:hypothetical protein